MRKDQHRRGLSPVVSLLGALLAFGLATSPSSADPPAKGCVNLVAFSASIARHGGSATRIPATGFEKARLLLDKAPNHAPVEADAAFFDEMPDGSSAIVFAQGTCVSAILLTPPSIPKTALKQILFDEKPGPKEETLPPGMARA